MRLSMFCIGYYSLTVYLPATILDRGVGVRISWKLLGLLVLSWTVQERTVSTCSRFLGPKVSSACVRRVTVLETRVLHLIFV